MFLKDLHVQYIRKISSDTVSFEYLVTQHLRMSGVYWGLTALSILGSGLEDNDIVSENNSALNVSTVDKTIIDWIMSCQDSESGGFGGNTSHDPHILYTLSAIQILALYDSLHLVDVQKVALYVKSLEQEDGSFFGDKWGEVDTRFSYCALSILSLTGQLHSGIIDIPRAVTFIERCRNFDGGFGAVPGAESHAGQIFCCVGALSIAGALSSVNHDLLGWWLSERQCDSGGLNGRPEKQPDVCYSWWILSTLSILGRTSWIDCDKLTDFILRCQDADGGGISDRPGNMSDVFHTFFGICGLSLMKRFEAIPSTNGENSTDSNGGGGSGSYRAIDPTYALPVDVIRRLGVTAQTLPTVS